MSTSTGSALYTIQYRPAGGEEVRVLVPDPGDGLVAHPGHAAVEDGGLAEDGRHVPALGPDKLRPLPLLVTGQTGHQVNIASFVPPGRF